MIKSKFVTLIVMMVLPLNMFADSFTTLWKQAMEAKEKDLPQTEIEVLKQISEKALNEKAYGHLLKSEMMIMSSRASISPDSLLNDVEALEAKEKIATKKNPVLGAVYASVLGTIYRNTYFLSENENNNGKASAYFKQSMSNPALLASVKTVTYEPFVENGIDSKIFDNDLLHVLGFEASDYKTLHDYYSSKGNRAAACYCALNLLRMKAPNVVKNIRKSKYVQSLDSLINTYRDLPIAGEVAIIRYNIMERAEDVTTEDKVDYIKYALNQWGTWQRMSILRNARIRLGLPHFHIALNENVVLPNVDTKLVVLEVCNVTTLTMKLTRVDVNSDTKLNPSVEKDYLRLKRLMDATPTYTQTKRYVGLPDYKLTRDTMVIKGLPIGMYMLEFVTDNSAIAPQRELLRVSNLYVMSQPLPNDELRMIVVNATTGHPVPNAKIKLSSNGFGDLSDGKVITCDAHGEAKISHKSSEDVVMFPYTNEDKYAAISTVSSNFYYNKDNSRGDVVKIFTDRSIYRPGQIVHGAVLTYRREGGDEVMIDAGRTVKVALRDANYKVVEEKTITADEYGSAAADFTIPTSGLNGRYSLQTYNSTTYFRVEEYKRPTFFVEFDKVEGKYQNGDTITVKGKVKSFAGVPVQGAMVNYTVSCSPAMWWCGYRVDHGDVIREDTIKTDDNGYFSVVVPLILPEVKNMVEPRFYNFNIAAKVTDVGGETHTGETYVPLGSSATSLRSDLPNKVEMVKLKTINFSYTNNAGSPIDGTVRYRIDNGTERTCKANTTEKFSMDGIKTGEHTLTAICGSDTLKQKVILFSLEDKVPVIKTDSWFYQTDSEFPSDGKPVYIQIGSSDPDQYILYNVISGNDVLESGIIRQSNALTTRAFTYKNEYGDGILLTYAWVKNGSFHSYKTEIIKPLPDKRLMLKWTTFRDKLTPGQKETWTLNVTRPDGKPANSQLLATMYDKSLDEIASHNWSLYLGMRRSLPYTRWYGAEYLSLSFYGDAPLNLYDESYIRLSHFCDCLPSYYLPWGVYETRMNSPKMMMAVAGSDAEVAKEAPSREMKSADVVRYRKTDESDGGNETTTKSSSSVQMRENLNETAFFFPALKVDNKGNVNISFTLPESVTTWRFIGFAHDKDLNYGFINGETVAKKTVMIQPNVPRFVRTNDKGTMAARIFNTSENTVIGNAKMEFVDPQTENVILVKEQRYQIAANGTGSVSFDFDAAKLPSLVIVRFSASGKGYSDGEQHYLAVLPDKELVTNTYPFTQNTKDEKVIDISKLFAVKDAKNKLTVEYTNNPTWLMVQTLPTIANANETNAVSLAATYYSNSIAKNILKQSPQIKTTIDQWRMETGNEKSLMSSLQKDQELKSLILSETPWVADAESEADRKQQLINFFDESGISYKLNDAVKKLGELQTKDGSFSWWRGMEGSLYITSIVTDILSRHNAMIGKQEVTKSMLNKAFEYLDRVIHKEVKELKKMDKGVNTSLRPSETAICYLYDCAITNRKLSSSQEADSNYLVELLSRQSTKLSIFGKAYSAVIFNKYKDKSPKMNTLANEYVQSIKEYTVYKEDMGRYYDAPKALYSWRDYRIPTQVAAIEALKCVTPNDKTTIEEMQRWLLQSKHTQCWDTPINTVNAVYAFLNGETSKLSPEENAPTVMKVDGKQLELSKETVGLGYVKTSMTGNNMRTFTANKTSSGTSWGALYAQFFQKTTEVEDASAGLKIKREILKDGKPVETLNVGDKVTVRITIKAERDYDFVQVTDRRAACMEPIGQLSGYHWGYYCSPRDNVTNYFFDAFAKGKHVVETEYYVDRSGTYQTGTCAAQCAYSPEYSARTAAKTIIVK